MLDWTGATAPAVLYRPPWQSSVGRDVVKLAASAGLVLDLWQALALEEMLGRTTADPWAPGSRWATPEVGLICPRQNGKDAILEALSLAALFLWHQSFVHTAHRMSATDKAFARLQKLILQSPHLRKRLLQPVRGRGITTGMNNKGIHLQDGTEAGYVARSGSQGRGFTVPILILNEAWDLTAEDITAQQPAQTTIPDPLMVYASSAPDQAVHPNAEVLAGLRVRALAGGDPDLAWIEWSADPHGKPGVGGRGPYRGSDPIERAAVERRHDEAAYARANPAYGIVRPDGTQGPSAAYLHRTARGPMPPRSYDVEHLGIGDWPVPEDDEWSVITEDQWGDLLDEESQLAGRLVLCPDITVDGTAAAVGVAGRRADQLAHVEVADDRPGVSWILPKIRKIRAEQPLAAAVLDPQGRAGELLQPLITAGFEVAKPGERVKPGKTPLYLMTAREVAQAHGAFVTGATNTPTTFRHIGQRSIADALSGATDRDLADAKAWARKGTSVNIAPVIAVTNALWALTALEATDRPTPAAPARAGAAPAAGSDSADLSRVGF